VYILFYLQPKHYGIFQGQKYCFTAKGIRKNIIRCLITIFLAFLFDSHCVLCGKTLSPFAYKPFDDGSNEGYNEAEQQGCPPIAYVETGYYFGCPFYDNYIDEQQEYPEGKDGNWYGEDD